MRYLRQGGISHKPGKYGNSLEVYIQASWISFSPWVFPKGDWRFILCGEIKSEPSSGVSVMAERDREWSTGLKININNNLCVELWDFKSNFLLSVENPKAKGIPVPSLPTRQQAKDSFLEKVRWDIRYWHLRVPKWKGKTKFDHPIGKPTRQLPWTQSFHAI